MSACVIQVLHGDTETHYCNPVLFTSAIEDPEEAYQTFTGLLKEFEDLVQHYFRDDVEWEIRRKDLLVEYRSTFPIEVIFTFDQVSGQDPVSDHWSRLLKCLKELFCIS